MDPPKQFSIAIPQGNSDESRFYGPYRGLLTDLFPKREYSMVVPLYKRPEQSKSVDFTTIFIVRHDEHPVFFIQIKHSAIIFLLLEKPIIRCGRDSKSSLTMLKSTNYMESAHWVPESVSTQSIHRADIPSRKPFLMI